MNKGGIPRESAPRRRDHGRRPGRRSLPFTPMQLDAPTIVQVLVLTAGIHMVLSFLRVTRGSGLFRGVIISLVVLFGALLGVARYLGLSELQFIVEGVTGFAAVILAIVFQPELRRGIVSLGDNPMLRRVIGARSRDVVDEVASACVAMAKRKQGALIAFERQSSLDTWAQRAAVLDAKVSRALIESIFHSGSALHDGAMILRSGRVVAAAAILPLTDNERLASSVGTRHRAALGLTEETDALVVAVSEETGLISVCQAGKMERRVVRDELASVLRARLGGQDDEEQEGPHRPPFWKRAWESSTNHLGQKLLALLFGIGLFWIAHRSIRRTENYSVVVQVAAGADASLAPTRGVLRVVLPSDSLDLRVPAPGTRIRLRATAEQSELAGITGGLGGVLVVDETWVGTRREIEPTDIAWGLGRVLPGIDVTLVQPAQISLEIDRYASAIVAPSTASLPLGLEEQQRLPEGLELDQASLEFDPPKVTLRGPSEAIARIESDPALLIFEPVDLSGERGSGFVSRVRLAAEGQGELSLRDDLFIRGDFRAKEQMLAQVELDVALVSMDAADPGGASRYLPPTDTVTILVRERGLFPAGVDEATRTRMLQEILRFVRENARVFVDVRGLEPNAGQRVKVETVSLDPLWRTQLSGVFDVAKADPRASLRIDIDDADATLALTER